MQFVNDLSKTETRREQMLKSVLYISSAPFLRPFPNFKMNQYHQQHHSHTADRKLRKIINLSTYIGILQPLYEKLVCL